MEELETFFLNKIKPYEERIQQLEDSEKKKELEIVTLKHAIQNLNRIIDQLKAQQPAGGKGSTGAGRLGSKATGPAGRDKAPQEEEKKGGVGKRPGTAAPGSSKDIAPKGGAKETNKPGKGTKAEPAGKGGKGETKKEGEEPAVETQKEESHDAEKKEEGEDVNA